MFLIVSVVTYCLINNAIFGCYCDFGVKSFHSIHYPQHIHACSFLYVLGLLFFTEIMHHPPDAIKTPILFLEFSLIELITIEKINEGEWDLIM